MQAQLSTKVSVETWQALDEYSKSSGLSKASIVEAALREYLERAKKEEGRRK